MSENEKTSDAPDGAKKPPEKKKPSISMRRVTHYYFLIALFLVLLVLTYLAPRIFITVPPGHLGVHFQRFRGGTQTAPDELLQEGIHYIIPVNMVYLYDCRVQEEFAEVNVLCKDGLNVRVRVSFWFRPMRQDVGRLHKHVGPKYIEKLVRPAIYATVRRILSQYSPVQLYSVPESQEMTIEIQAAGQSELGPRHVELVSVLIHSVHLPPILNTAIERKLRQEQEILEYAFRVEKEKEEKERKLIEAQGIAQFHETVQRGLTKDVLRLRGILATLNLSRSENAKIVIFGKPDGFGLPLIMGDLDGGGEHGKPADVPATRLDALDPSLDLSLRTDPDPAAGTHGVDMSLRPAPLDPKLEFGHEKEMKANKREAPGGGFEKQPSLYEEESPNAPSLAPKSPTDDRKPTANQSTSESARPPAETPARRYPAAGISPQEHYRRKARSEKADTDIAPPPKTAGHKEAQ